MDDWTTARDSRWLLLNSFDFISLLSVLMTTALLLFFPLLFQPKLRRRRSLPFSQRE